MIGMAGISTITKQKKELSEVKTAYGIMLTLNRSITREQFKKEFVKIKRYIRELDEKEVA